MPVWVLQGLDWFSPPLSVIRFWAEWALLVESVENEAQQDSNQKLGHLAGAVAADEYMD